MKVIIAIGFIALIAYGAQLYFPWWIIAVVAFLIAVLFSDSGGKAFLSGFAGIFLLWFIHALIIDISTDSILTEKIAALFFVQYPIILIAITAIIGGLVGGMGALSGYYLRSTIINKNGNNRYLYK